MNISNNEIVHIINLLSYLFLRLSTIDNSLLWFQVLSLTVPFFKSFFLGPSLVFMLLYVWSREFPTSTVSIMGLVNLQVSSFLP